MQISMLLILILLTNSCFAYEAQELIPIPRTELKSYPVLDELEGLIYPKYNFSKDNPGERLGRLEIAVFGSKQNGNIKSRISQLQSETMNWQITKIKTQTKPSHQRIIKSYQSIPYSSHIRIQQKPRSKDYDYLNYRLMTPLIQNIGRESIRKMFRGKN